MKKSVLFSLMVLGLAVSANAVTIQVPWDEATQRYYLKWEGISGISSGNYDPDVVGGTYQKTDSDKWTATGWDYNYGQWTYEFVGGPADNKVENVTVNVLCSQAGAANWHYGKLSIDNGVNFFEDPLIYMLQSAQANESAWRGTTFGSSTAPLNISTICVRDIIWNGSYATSVQTTGMEIIGRLTTPVDRTIQVPWDETTQRYYLKWEGINDISSGNYDPVTVGGTYQKSDSDKWIATGWDYNYGQWKYRFVGGPAANPVASVTINVLCSQAGVSNWHYGKFSTDGTTWSEQLIYELPSGQANELSWRGATFGSNGLPLNISEFYARDIIWNGSNATSVQTGGMEIIGNIASPPPPIQVPWDEASGTYTLSWYGYNDIAGGEYDPCTVHGTYQKFNGSAWIATNWDTNWGQWEYTFDTPVESVTISLYIYQHGAYVWNTAVWGTTAQEADTRFANTDWLFEIDTMTPYNDWKTETLGSAAEPLNTEKLYFRHILANGNATYSAAGQLIGMTVTATPMPQAPQMPGDANGDTMVDVGDLGILAANYGRNLQAENVDPSLWWSKGDFNNDHLVDVGDLGILAAHYGEGVPNPAMVDLAADYAKAFGTTVTQEEDSSEEIGSSICSGLGLPLITGLALMGLMLVKLEE